MTLLKVGMIGCGRIGQRHAEHIHAKAELTAVCDIDYEKALKFSQQYGCKAYSSLSELLENEPHLDLMAICSPNGLHAEHSITCLQAGINVLCEKPLAINADDCGEMIKAAEQANKRLFVIKQNRFNPPVAAVKAALDQKVLGKIYSVQLSCFWNRNADYYANSWKGTRLLDGGTLYTQFSHFVDLLYWLIGDVKRVYALTGNFAHHDIIEFEDTGVVALEFNNGALGTINYTVNSFGKNMEGSLTIFGEKGTVKIGGQYLNELEYQNIDGFEFKDLPEGNKANNYGTYQGSMSNHDKVYENVINVLTQGGIISTNSFEGLKTVEIIDKIYRSANQLSTIPVKEQEVFRKDVLVPINPIPVVKVS
ncbi:Gfo/Idh/MocA family protein [Solitalea canadensis]|uniref:Putative dehydrogenase n=1 Tax=Solitalea canadensis (strain ATCC 29591 / DSM 3403 / JCM 21819 / LMG 8368 / NBRC 15130 / NCIMB 12057 / USAM 9D) TaxID=929556 RepID=H8KNP8_SOLCM|nr:Gfo/Idh/MocA family oxidoreductase [Solitalea canadensis]AFD08181.1 putative dehydrogenase [Solitalea canadensis DSM 3403]